MISHSRQSRSRLISSSLVFLLIFIISGCDQDEGTSSNPSPDPQTQDGTDNQPANADNDSSNTDQDQQTQDNTDNQPANADNDSSNTDQDQQTQDNNHYPTARITASNAFTSGKAVTLDGSSSSDPDGDTLSFQWTQTEGPDITLTDSTNPSLNFVAPSVAEPTQCSFELSVHDGALSNSASVSILISPIADNTSPSIVSRSPQSGQNGVSPTGEIHVVFDEALLETSIDSQSLVVSQNDRPVAGAVSYDSGSNTITYKPSSDLFVGASYTVTLANTITDLAGNAFAGDSWSFSTNSDSDTDSDVLLDRNETELKAFPTAEGYGRYTEGGRGGRVIEVTNLNDSGPGSLRDAVMATGPRTVVFRVSGVINLKSKLVIKTENNHLTVAGQTAPGKGIVVHGWTFGMIGGEHVILRFIRTRVGTSSGETMDGMGITGSLGPNIYDHVSISWTIDEGFSSRGTTEANFTLQRSIISEALNEAGHAKYGDGAQHGYAASIGGDIGSFHHNLLAHNAGRNWSLAGGLLHGTLTYAGRLDIRNNVVYNWKHRTTDGGAFQVNFVNNYYKPGPASEVFVALNAQNDGFEGGQWYYFAGNVMPGYFDESNQEAGRIATGKPRDYDPWATEPFFESYVETQTAGEAYEDVLSNVGANRPILDDHDTRIIQETRDGTYTYSGSKTGLPGLPDNEADVGGLEDYPEIVRPASWDSDHDGMPDEWEIKHGLNPSDESDRNNTNLSKVGYTNLEMYLNEIAGDFE